ncbi:MAG: hypothetical protein TR69_WS6001001302 [candidate division WS6 bacterium OLB20]|uniref:Uncharacterized protein n=1 Tax=candidate division WS6 bacterium OLB20 TaxID=1617426 RepID=A0A136LWH4_9BACT|nr:MAG: hypothetical protein TR69_WS6001001302 [candidate division WS6 bacterium OLB20]
MKERLSSLSSFQKTVAALVLLIVAAVSVNLGQVRKINQSDEIQQQEQGVEVPDELPAEGQTSDDQQDAPAAVMGATDRTAVVFYDKNSDGVKDDAEEGCNTCVAKVLVTAQKSGSFPSLAGLSTAGIGSQGTVSEEELLRANTVWAFYPDRKIYIRPQLVSVGDGAGDITIAAQDVSISVSAENASLVSTEESGSSTVFAFSQLIPSMQSAAAENRPVFAQVIPDPSQPDLYYVGSGTLKKDPERAGSPDGYTLTVNFDTSETLSELSPEQVHFFLL